MARPPSDDGLPVGLRERKKARTRFELMSAAIQLFRDKGFAETTVADIVDSVEYSSSTFFRYFESKEDVVFYGNDPRRLAADLQQQLVAQPDTPPWALLRSVLTTDTIWMITAEPSLLADCIALWSTEPAIIKRRQQLIVESVNVVAEFAKATWIKGRTADLDALIIGHAVLGVTTEVINLGPMPEATIVARLNRGFDFVERGFAPWST